MDNSIVDILLNCEQQGFAPPYMVNADTYKTEKSSLFKQGDPLWTDPCLYQSDKEDIFIVSDLHIASGRNVIGVYKGTENFFADDAFSRFLSNAKQVKKTRQAILVINGDIFDFLRTSEYPGKVKKTPLSARIRYFLKFRKPLKPVVIDAQAVEQEYREWSDELKKCGIIKTPEQLEACISDNEEEYGLQTDDYKTIYKLIRIRQGHPSFFKALAQWLDEGNKLVIVKGNHDLELYWPAVRNYIRLILGETIAQQTDLKEVLLQKVLPNITFIDDAVVIDNTLFIEHGHRLDKFTMVLPSPTLIKTPGQINIPFGSFFNRYLINKLELFYPNLDKVRPAGNIMPMLVKEDFPLALKVLVKHVPFMLRILSTNPRYIGYMFNRVMWWVLILLIPLAIIGFEVYTKLKGLQNVKSNFIVTFLEGGVKSTGILVAGYLLSRIVAWFQLDEPSSLSEYAKIKFEGKSFKFVVMGHTHNPDASQITPSCSFFNTGTWIPVIEISTAEVREDKMYTFLHFTWNEQEELMLANTDMLQRWNDDATRPDPQIIVERK
jgi:UDP-2,3-diacylglucosamine pyrophosphatase LpxH